MKFSFLSALALLMVLLTFSAPFVAIAQQQETSEVVQAKRAAKQDAALAVNSMLWFGSGFLCGIFAVGGAAFYKPTIDPVRLMGKSPGYVTVYTDTYNTTARSKQLLSSSMGCLSWVTVALYIRLTLNESGF